LGKILNIKKLPSKKTFISIVLILVLTVGLGNFFKSLSAPGQKLEERFNVWDWMYKSDYSIAYYTNEMNEVDKVKFKEVVNVEKMNYLLSDSYVFSGHT
jgi:hypothetical protein